MWTFIRNKAYVLQKVENEKMAKICKISNSETIIYPTALADIHPISKQKGLKILNPI